MANIGDIYLVKIYFEDNKNCCKIRPTIIINKNIDELKEELFTISQITGEEPKIPPSHYDKFKEPIVQWRKSGLDKMSFVKTNRLLVVKSDKLYRKIGEMDNGDFERILQRIILENS